MKFFLLIIILLLTISTVFSQDKKPNLTITGNVKEIAMQEIYPNSESAFYITYIKLNLKLKNNSPVPLIFLQNNPIISFAEIISSDKSNNDLLAKTDGSTSSFALTNNEWKELKKKFDQNVPPNKITRLINPNEEIEFEGFVRLNIPRFSTNISFPIYSNTLDFIKKHAPTQIKTTYETWTTLNLIKGSTEEKKAEFADKLQNKWKNFGYLWTQEITAEPISIDFDSVIFKTLID